MDGWNAGTIGFEPMNVKEVEDALYEWYGSEMYVSENPTRVTIGGMTNLEELIEERKKMNKYERDKLIRDELLEGVGYDVPGIENYQQIVHGPRIHNYGEWEGTEDNRKEKEFREREEAVAKVEIKNPFWKRQIKEKDDDIKNLREISMLKHKHSKASSIEETDMAKVIINLKELQTLKKIKIFIKLLTTMETLILL